MTTRSRSGWPLSVVVPLLAALNFALVLIICLVLLGTPFGGGPDAILRGPIINRAAAIAGDIDDGLQTFPPEDWNTLLEADSARLGVTLVLVEPGGRLAAGPDLPITDEVARAAQQQRTGGPAGDGPGRFGGGPDSGRPRERGPIERVMVVRTKETGQPVVCVRIPIHSDFRRPPRPGLLLIVTKSDLHLATFAGVHWYLLAGIGVLVMSMLLWWPLVHRLRARLRELGDTTASIAAGKFVATRPARAPRELAQLATRIDEMSARLEHLVGGQKRFVADVAHELCSPLARLQMALGILEERVGEADSREIREETNQLSELVQELLMFSKAASGATSKPEAILLRELVERVVQRERAGAEVTIQISDSTRVMAVPSLLARAVANLIRNAVRYAGASGPIVVGEEALADGVCLTVVDHGPGVPEGAIANLGDPFFRPEAARTRETGGNGLGLAIVKTCIAACGGELVFRNLRSGNQTTGFEARITLVRAQSN